MASYRAYFLSGAGKIQGKHDFDAADVEAAMIVAELLAEACSDVCWSYELWQGPRCLSPTRDASRPRHPAAAIATATQETVLQREEMIRDSEWRIAQSRQLLARIEALHGELTGMRNL